jgi:predicted kinase
MLLQIYRGLPGSGKSTAAARLAEKCETVSHIEPDHYMTSCNGDYTYTPELHQYATIMCQVHAEAALRSGRSVVVAEVLATPDDVVPYVALARRVGVGLVIKTFDADYGNIHRVTQADLDSMAVAFVEHEELMAALRSREN